jgi:outer membrane lipoprotein-sorting protein
MQWGLALQNSKAPAVLRALSCCVVAMKNPHVLLLQLLLLICSGCATFSIKHKPLPPLADPHAYLQSIVNAQAPGSFSATARIKTQSQQGKLTARAAVFARTTSSLRVELYGFLNQLVFLFTTDGTTMSFFYPNSGSFYSGNVADQNLALLFGGKISPSDAVDLLCGLPPIIPFTYDRVVSTKDSSWYQIELISDSKLRQHIWIDPTRKKVVKYILYDASGKPLREFSFADFKLVGDFMVPLKIELIFNESGTRLAVEYQDVNIPHHIDNQLFIMTPPAGVKMYSLKELPQSPLIQPQ